MKNTVLLYVSFSASLVVFGLLAWRHLVPWMQRVDLADPALRIVGVHGSIALLTVVDTSDLSATFTDPQPQLAMAVLAYTAFFALLWGASSAVPLTWATNIGGFAVVAFWTVNDLRVDADPNHFVTAVLYPLMLVAHVSLAWRMTGDRASAGPSD